MPSDETLRSHATGKLECLTSEVRTERLPSRNCAPVTQRLYRAVRIRTRLAKTPAAGSASSASACMAELSVEIRKSLPLTLTFISISYQKEVKWNPKIRTNPATSPLLLPARHVYLRSHSQILTMRLGVAFTLAVAVVPVIAQRDALTLISQQIPSCAVSTSPILNYCPTVLTQEKLPCLNETLLPSTCLSADIDCACEVASGSPLLNGCAMRSCSFGDALGSHGSLIFESWFWFRLALTTLSSRNHQRNRDSMQHPYARQGRRVVRNDDRFMLDCARLYLASTSRRPEISEKMGASGR